MILQTAMTAGVPYTFLDTSGLSPIHSPIAADISGITEEEEHQYAADQIDEERRRIYEAEVKKNNAVGLVQRMLRGHLSRSKQLPEITPDMGPQMPDFSQAAAPGSDVMLDMMKDTLWETNKIGIMSYKDVYAMVLQYNKQVGLKDIITLLNKTPNRTLTIARRTMLHQ